jgi:hypothetical protein
MADEKLEAVQQLTELNDRFFEEFTAVTDALQLEQDLDQEGHGSTPEIVWEALGGVAEAHKDLSQAIVTWVDMLRSDGEIGSNGSEGG